MQLIEVPVETAFQALSDPIRLRAVRLMAVTGQEACLCELVDSLLEPQYKLSRHLKILRGSGILSAEKEGRWVYHRLAQRPPHLQRLFELIIDLPDPGHIFAADLDRFQSRLSLREDGRCRVGILTADGPKAGTA